MNKKASGKFKKTIISVMILMILAAALFLFTSCKSDYRKTLDGETGTAAASVSGTGTTTAAETTAQPANPAAQQITEVTANSGGYLPGKIEAKAGVPTILVMKSEGAYGCERAFNIPDLKISGILPENGQTQFDLGAHAKGTKLLGVCSMGMYYFQIFFN